jgi:hypothetical protein
MGTMGQSRRLRSASSIVGFCRLSSFFYFILPGHPAAFYIVGRPCLLHQVLSEQGKIPLCCLYRIPDRQGWESAESMTRSFRP